MMMIVTMVTTTVSTTTNLTDHWMEGRGQPTARHWSVTC